MNVADQSLLPHTFLALLQQTLTLHYYYQEKTLTSDEALSLAHFLFAVNEMTNEHSDMMARSSPDAPSSLQKRSKFSQHICIMQN